MGRARLITAASFAGSVGWGTILPYQYAYVVDARHWGAIVGVLTGTLFCLGAVAAAPFAGRLADRYPAGSLALSFSLVAAAACVAMGFASTSWQFLGAILIFGGAITASMPATQVLVLECVDPVDRRKAFAYQFTGAALGMAVGSFAAGWIIDLHSTSGMWPAFGAAAVGFAAAAGLLGLAAGTTSYPRAGTTGDDPLGSGLGGLAAYRRLLGSRQVRLLAVVSMLLAAGFYAQFETGLPAFALQSLRVAPSTVGSAAAVNCVVIVTLQWLVVKVTGRHGGAALLAVVGAIWAATWLLLELALFARPGTASLMFVVSFGVFAVGETMYAPMLSPLAAATAPPGMVGTTLGALAALRTGISAAGPLIAGLLLALHLPHVFVLGHVAINALAVVVAWRLSRAQHSVPDGVDTGENAIARSAHV